MDKDFEQTVLEHLRRQSESTAERSTQMNRIEEKLDEQKARFQLLESQLEKQDAIFSKLESQLETHDDYFAVFLETMNKHHQDVKHCFDLLREDIRSEVQLTQEMCLENKERLNRNDDVLEGIKKKAEHLDIRISVAESKAG